jgi:hypothetical protein
MDVRRALSTFVLLSSVLLAHAQTAGPTAATSIQIGRISGTVLHLTTGQPLAGIEVSISPTEQPDASVQVLTGPDGRFAFDNLPRGKYSLVAQGRGYGPQSYQQHGPYSTAIAIGPELKSEHLIFRLAPDASISGTVVDEENEPVRSGQVFLFARGDGNGSHAPHWQGESTLDEQGRYHFGHLRPGTYLLAVSAQPWYAQDSQVMATQQPLSVEDSPSASPDSESATPQDVAPHSSLDVTYPLTYYPGATEPGNAAPIVLNSGERTAADVTLRAVPALHLKIRGASSDSSRPTAAVVLQRIFDSPDTTPIPLQVRSQQASPGVLSLTGIAPGHLLLALRTFTGKEWTTEDRELDLSADTEIDASENTFGPVTVEGIVQLPGGAPVPPTTYIRLFNRRTGETFGARVSPNGTFEAQQALAGSTTFEVSVFGVADLTVHDMTATGATVAGRTLQLPRSGSVILKVAMAKGLARVDGTALRQGKPVAETMVLLVPEQPERDADLFRRDQSDSDGTFSFFQVVPGRYSVLAIANGWDLDWQDPAVLKPFLEHGQPIQVTTPRRYQVSVTAQDNAITASPLSPP